MDPPEALHGIVDADIGTGRLTELVQGQRAFSWIGSRTSSASSRRPGMSRRMVSTQRRTWAATPPRTASTRPSWRQCHDFRQNGLDAVNALGSNAGDAGKDAIDPVQDVGDEARQDRESVLGRRVSTPGDVCIRAVCSPRQDPAAMGPSAAAADAAHLATDGHGLLRVDSTETKAGAVGRALRWGVCGEWRRWGGVLSRPRGRLGDQLASSEVLTVAAREELRRGHCRAQPQAARRTIHGSI